MDFRKFSGQYLVRRLTEEDVPAICGLCRGNPQYYRHCPPFVTEESIREDMRALPPKKTLEDKYYLGYFDQDRLIAVMDFIFRCPREDMSFLGFFMLESSVQGKGTGSGIIGELCDYLPRVGCTAIRLGWVAGNKQAEHFWKKNGFQETGVITDTERYRIVMGERKLGSGFPSDEAGDGEQAWAERRLSC